MRAEKSLDHATATELELMVATLDKFLAQPELGFNLVCDLNDLDTAQSHIVKRGLAVREAWDRERLLGDLVPRTIWVKSQTALSMSVFLLSSSLLVTFTVG